MSLLLVEGFDDGLYLSRNTGNGSWNGLTTGRTGSYGRDFYGNNATNWYTAKDADKHATFIFGIAVYPLGSIIDNAIELYGDNYATKHIQIDWLAATSAIKVKRGDGTELGTTDTNVLPNNKWSYVEVKILLSDTVGTVDVHVNGVSELSLTGQDTKNGGTATVFDTIKLRGNGSYRWYGDDFYFCNGAGTLNNDFLGDCRIYTLFPDGNGNYSQLTGSDGNSTDNYLLVDENPNPSSTDYVGDSTAGNKDTYAFDDLTPTVGTIRGVATGLYAAKSDAGTKHARPVIRRSSTDATGADATLSTSYDVYDEIFEEDPVASAAWTVSTVNASEFGFEVRA